MPSEADSCHSSVELGRTEHDGIFRGVGGGKFPLCSMLFDWGGSPHYCASIVSELSSELDEISKEGGRAGTKLESILSLVRQAVRRGHPVSVVGGGNGRGAVSSDSVSPVA